MAYENAPRVIRLEEPLVGIDGDGVCCADPFEEPGTLVREYRRAAIGSVDVQPERMCLLKIREIDKGIDRTGVRCTRCGYDDGWPLRGTVRPVQESSKLPYVHAELFVGREDVDVVGGPAQGAQVARNARMGLIGEEQSRSSPPSGPLRAQWRSRVSLHW